MYFEYPNSSHLEKARTNLFMKHIILECANFAPHDELQKGFANYYMETNYVDENRFLNQKSLQSERARFMHGWSRNNVGHSCIKLIPEKN